MPLNTQTRLQRLISGFSLEKAVVAVVILFFALIVISGIYGAVKGTPMTGGGYYSNHYDNDSLLDRSRDSRRYNSLRNRNNRRR